MCGNNSSWKAFKLSDTITLKINRQASSLRNPGSLTLQRPGFTAWVCWDISSYSKSICMQSAIFSHEALLFRRSLPPTIVTKAGCTVPDWQDNNWHPLSGSCYPVALLGGMLFQQHPCQSLSALNHLHSSQRKWYKEQSRPAIKWRLAKFQHHRASTNIDQKCYLRQASIVVTVFFAVDTARPGSVLSIKQRKISNFSSDSKFRILCVEQAQHHRRYASKACEEYSYCSTFLSVYLLLKYTKTCLLSHHIELHISIYCN